jgi:hypothetical protein
MGRLLAFFLILSGAFSLGGCAGSDQDDSQRVSTIPWNRPENWESQGPLGSMMNSEGR